ncbi:hypothetical protein GCM10028778_22860 [Barrientosiimonas marina]|uniref:ImmA/IrrE family metallo-endopeptidase n=1 Tax=Lentibacillus kimchii TaxID=1542911 RepID=A0ABW2UUG6_9BACI
MMEAHDLNNLLDAYSQSRYDFDPKKLTKTEINSIKKLAREKRADYGIAPIGTNIFDYINLQEKNIYFEKQSFHNPDLDGMIIVLPKSRDIAFIILNSSQPLLNQIFATAHEYYHYLVDLEGLKKTPHVCSLSQLNEKSEQKASRFAAEFLLPDEALNVMVDDWLSRINKNRISDTNITDLTLLSHRLTIKYGLPLKAVLYRLFEEEHITEDKFQLLISNYDFIKGAFKESQRVYKREVNQLIANENPYIDEIMYEKMPKAFDQGYVSLDKLKWDADQLSLDKERLDVDTDITEDSDDEDDEYLMDLKKYLNSQLEDDS